METIFVFIGQLIFTLAAAFLLSAVFSRFLRPVLVDLCGTTERAQFWTVFSRFLLLLLPALFGLGFEPQAEPGLNLFFDLTRQLRWNLLGFVMALLGVGAAVVFFALVAPRPQTKG